MPQITLVDAAGRFRIARHGCEDSKTTGAQFPALSRTRLPHWDDFDRTLSSEETNLSRRMPMSRGSLKAYSIRQYKSVNFKSFLDFIAKAASLS